LQLVFNRIQILAFNEYVNAPSDSTKISAADKA